MISTDKVRQKVYGVPYVDIHEKDDEVILVADMPGVDDKSGKVVFESGVLTIEGERNKEIAVGYTALRSERRVDVYRRLFEVSDAVDPTKIQANMKNGVLTVRMPRREEHRTRRIEISTD